MIINLNSSHNLNDVRAFENPKNKNRFPFIDFSYSDVTTPKVIVRKKKVMYPILQVIHHVMISKSNLFDLDFFKIDFDEIDRFDTPFEHIQNQLYNIEFNKNQMDYSFDLDLNKHFINKVILLQERFISNLKTVQNSIKNANTSSIFFQLCLYVVRFGDTISLSKEELVQNFLKSILF